MTCPNCSATCVGFYTHTVPAGVRKGERYSECKSCYASQDGKSTQDDTQYQTPHVLPTHVSPSRARIAKPGSTADAAEGDLFSRSGE